MPAKKAKLCVTKTSEKSQKLTHNTKNSTLQTMVEAGTSSVINKVADNSSGSEYIPSDDEVNSGNILMSDVHVDKFKTYNKNKIFCRCGRQSIA